MENNKVLRCHFGSSLKALEFFFFCFPISVAGPALLHLNWQSSATSTTGAFAGAEPWKGFLGWVGTVGPHGILGVVWNSGAAQPGCPKPRLGLYALTRAGGLAHWRIIPPSCNPTSRRMAMPTSKTYIKFYPPLLSRGSPLLGVPESRLSPIVGTCPVFPGAWQTGVFPSGVLV